jgi:hypothetical protein
MKGQAQASIEEALLEMVARHDRSFDTAFGRDHATTQDCDIHNLARIVLQIYRELNSKRGTT